MPKLWPGRRERSRPERVAEATAEKASRAGRSFSVTVPDEMLHDTNDPKLWNTDTGLIARRITREQALQVPAFTRARNMICGTLGTLPLRAINDERGDITRQIPLLRNLDPNVAPSVFLTWTYEDLLLEGFAYWKIETTAPGTGWPTSVSWLPACKVTTDPRTGKATYEGTELTREQVIQFVSPNPPLLTAGARAIRVALKLDRSAEGFSESPQPLGYFTPADGMPEQDDEEIDKALSDWDASRRVNATGYVPKALAYRANSYSPAELQLIEARQHAVLEISRVTGIDAEDLGVSTTSRTYQNDEQRRLALLDFVLRPFAEAVEGRLSLGDVTPRGTNVRTDWSTFLRTDTASRYAAYDVGLRTGAVTTEEVRVSEERPALTPEQQARVDAERKSGGQAAPAQAPAGE